MFRSFDEYLWTTNRRDTQEYAEWLQATGWLISMTLHGGTIITTKAAHEFIFCLQSGNDW